MDKKFEALFIYKAVSGPALEKARQETKSILDGLGVKTDSEEDWGKRTLAYEIKKVKEGYYVFSSLTAAQDKIKDLRRKMEGRDELLRFLVLSEA